MTVLNKELLNMAEKMKCSCIDLASSQTAIVIVSKFILYY